MQRAQAYKLFFMGGFFFFSSEAFKMMAYFLLSPQDWGEGYVFIAFFPVIGQPFRASEMAGFRLDSSYLQDFVARPLPPCLSWQVDPPTTPIKAIFQTTSQFF